MRKIMLVLLLVLTSVIIFGCRAETPISSEAEITKTKKRLDDNNKLKLDILFNSKKIGEITKVSVSKPGVSPVVVKYNLYSFRRND